MKVTKYQEERILSRYENYNREATELDKNHRYAQKALAIRARMNEMRRTLEILGISVTIDPETGKAIFQY